MDQYYGEMEKNDIELSNMKSLDKILFDGNNRIKLIVMLYDGCIGYIKKSIDFLNSGDTVNKNIYIDKAKNIITELEKALNLTNTDSISEDLKILYSFLNNYLSKASLEDDIKALDDVINMLITLRESWDHVGNSLFKNCH